MQAEYPEVVTRLTKLLEQYVAEGRSTPGVKQANDVRVKLIKASAKPPKDKPALKAAAKESRR